MTSGKWEEGLILPGTRREGKNTGIDEIKHLNRIKSLGEGTSLCKGGCLLLRDKKEEDKMGSHTLNFEKELRQFSVNNFELHKISLSHWQGVKGLW